MKALILRTIAAAVAVALVNGSDASAQPFRQLFGRSSSSCPGGACPAPQARPAVVMQAASSTSTATSTTTTETTTETVAYVTLLERVSRGEVVWVSFGEPTRLYVRCDDAPAGVTPGLYRCYRGLDGPKMQFFQPVKRVPRSTAAHWTFPGSTRGELIHHILTDPMHRGRYSWVELNAMGFEQLLDLHDADHTGRR